MLRKNHSKPDAEAAAEGFLEGGIPITQDAADLPPFPVADSEGELAIDVFQTPTSVVIQSPVAGVKEEDLEVSVEGDMITVRGKREREETIDEKDFYCQECYWGSFSRTVSLPTIDIDIDKAEASLKNGILTVRIPRVEKKRSKKLRIGKE